VRSCLCPSRTIAIHSEKACSSFSNSSPHQQTIYDTFLSLVAQSVSSRHLAVVRILLTRSMPSAHFSSPPYSFTFALLTHPQPVPAQQVLRLDPSLDTSQALASQAFAASQALVSSAQPAQQFIHPAAKFSPATSPKAPSPHKPHDPPAALPPTKSSSKLPPPQPKQESPPKALLEKKSHRKKASPPSNPQQPTLAMKPSPPKPQPPQPASFEDEPSSNTLTSDPQRPTRACRTPAKVSAVLVEETPLPQQPARRRSPRDGKDGPVVVPDTPMVVPDTPMVASAELEQCVAILLSAFTQSTLLFDSSYAQEINRSPA
jgi:hypothetical protein